jgi:hypothetical protein
MTAEQVLAITSQVNFATIITGIAAVGAAVALVYITTKGVRMLLGMIRG